MIVGIRVFAWLRKSNAMTWHALQCVDSFHVDHGLVCCSLCPQLLKSAAVSNFSRSIKFQVPAMGAFCSCDNDGESYEAAGVSMKSHLRIANPAETKKQPCKTHQNPLFQLRCSACQVPMKQNPLAQKWIHDSTGRMKGLSPTWSMSEGKSRNQGPRLLDFPWDIHQVGRRWWWERRSEVRLQGEWMEFQESNFWNSCIFMSYLEMEFMILKFEANLR